MQGWPEGTVTFLFTDVEGSTRLAQHQAGAWEQLRLLHDDAVHAAVDSGHGVVFQKVGDAFCAAFHTPGDALRAAIQAQNNLQNALHGDLRVRMGIHTGEAQAVNSDYRGYLTLSLVQRLMSAAHGGQVLVTQASESLLRPQLEGEIKLIDLGRYKLKDVPDPVRIFQVTAPGLPADFPALRAADLFQTNLPIQITSFVGRDKELSDLQRLLPDAHLLTLVGPGGTGKTRLAIEAARRVLEGYTDGVWLVELGRILDPLLVPRTTALAIGLRDEPQRPVIDMLGEYLQDKKMLVILDNCEHLVDACARMTESLVHRAPGVHLLVTSREALGVPGEVTYRVPSLSLPAAEGPRAVEAVMQSEAARLFVDRAVTGISAFAVTSNNAATLAQICRRLDGIPMAIELAAAKMRVLSIDQIAERLDDRFRLLTGGSRTALERHQTLRATLDWSHDLLPPAEQLLFRRLATFVGGWTLEAAEEVCAGQSAAADVPKEEVLTLLENLINKSLVVAEGSDGISRYQMLETTRHYAGEKLAASGESAALRAAHFAYFLRLAEQAEPHLRRAEQVQWLKRLDPDHENFRLALAWSMDLPSAESVLRLAGALGTFWGLRGHWLEGASWQDRALARPWDVSSAAEKAARARVLYRRTSLASWLDELDVLGSSARLALALCEELGDGWGTAFSRGMVAWHLQRIGRYTAADPLITQSLRDFRDMADPWGEAVLLRVRTFGGPSQADQQKRADELERSLACARLSGDRERIVTALVDKAFSRAAASAWDQAEALLKEADALGLELGNPTHIVGRKLHADILLAQGETSAGEAELHSMVEWCQRVGERNMQALALATLGALAEQQNRLADAVRYVARCVALYRDIGLPAAVSRTLGFLAYLEDRGGALTAALAYQQESLGVLQQELLDEKYVGGTGLCFTAGLFVSRDPHIAARLLGFDDRVNQTFGAPGPADLASPYRQRFASELRQKLGEDKFGTEWDAGVRMSVDEGLAFALAALDTIE